jgi:hypothetical protein
MSEATIRSSEARTPNPQSPRKATSLSGKTRAALFAEWKRFSANIVGPEELDDRGLRLWWTNQQLNTFYAKHGGRFVTIDRRRVFIPCDRIVVNSWSSLRAFEVHYLLWIMREESGDGPAYRAELIERIARDLWGPDAWRPFLIDRLMDRFGIVGALREAPSRAVLEPPLQDLAPDQAHALIEELLSRLARKQIALAGDTPEPEVVEHKIEGLRKTYSRKGAKTLSGK